MKIMDYRILAASEMIDFEKARLSAKLQGARTKSRLTPAQEQLRDEFVAKMLAVVDEELSCAMAGGHSEILRGNGGGYLAAFG
jgi:hypothetical protein